MNFDIITQLGVGGGILILVLKMTFAFLKEYKLSISGTQEKETITNTELMVLLKEMKEDAKTIGETSLTILRSQTLLLEKMNLILMNHDNTSQKNAERIEEMIKESK